MIAVYANFNVSDNNISELLDLANNLISETRKEDGNISYELIRGIKSKNLFAFLEKWSDQESLDRHMNTSHFKALAPQIGKLANGEMQLNVHEVLI